MSQTSRPTGQGRPGQGRPGQGRPGQGRRGQGRPGQGGPRRERRPRVEKEWIPQTALGKKVASGEISSIEEILSNGLRIQ